MTSPPLKSLHPDSSLSQAKLAQFSKLSTDELVSSLSPGRPGSLKTRPDGTVIDGHHRLAVLRNRGVDIEALPREVIPKDVLNP
jgi:ParB-like chromosome segregation protein Spo0J